MLTTGFPRFEGDLFGTFVFEQARALAAIQIGVEVLAPHDRGACRNETKDGVGIRRFRYLYPTSWQRLAYGGGIPTNLKESWLARLQVPLFLAAFWWAARRQVGGADLVHCHWTVTGLVARWAAGRRPVVLSVRGSDINLMQRGVAAWLNRRIYQRVDRVVAVSEDIANKLAQAGGRT